MNLIYKKRFPKLSNRTLDSYLYSRERKEFIYEDGLVELAVQKYLTEEMADYIVPVLDILMNEDLVFIVMVCWLNYYL